MLKNQMISFFLGLITGLVLGVIGGLYYFSKLYKKFSIREIEREIVQDIIGQKPGDIIKVSKIEEYIKTHDGEEVHLGDLIDE